MTSYDYLVEALEERAEKRAEKRAEIRLTKRIEEVTEEVTGRVTEEAKENERVEVIKNARLNGLTIELIANIVKLPVAKVRSILDNLGIE